MSTQKKKMAKSKYKYAIMVFEADICYVYIGETVNIRSRWGSHQSYLRRGTHHAPTLQNAFNSGKHLYYNVLTGYDDFTEKETIQAFESMDGFLVLNRRLTSRSDNFERLQAMREYTKKPIEVSLGGKVLGRFDSITEASRKLGTPLNRLKRVLHGKVKKTLEGYTAQYLHSK